jgi:hypothetical protein
MSKLKEFTTQAARPLPVIVLADVSGSMGVDGKIQALNHAVREMIEAFQDESDLRAEIHVSVITFGGQAAFTSRWRLPAALRGLTSGRAAGRRWAPRSTWRARWSRTSNVGPSRAYRPTIVLVSDGQPTDEWKSRSSAPRAASAAARRSAWPSPSARTPTTPCSPRSSPTRGARVPRRRGPPDPPVLPARHDERLGALAQREPERRPPCGRSERRLGPVVVSRGRHQRSGPGARAGGAALPGRLAGRRHSSRELGGGLRRHGEPPALDGRAPAPRRWRCATRGDCGSGRPWASSKT